MATAAMPCKMWALGCYGTSNALSINFTVAVLVFPL